MSETMKKNDYCVSNEDTCDIDKQEENKVFTQSQVEAIVAERLRRERKANQALNGVRQLLKDVSQKGLVKGDSYSLMAQEIVEKLKDKQKTDSDTQAVEEEQTLAETSSVAGGDGEENTPQQNDGGNDNDRKEAVIANDTENEGTGFIEVLSKLKEKYPKESIEVLLTGNLFESFAKGRSENPQEIFDDFLSFMKQSSSQNGTRTLTDDYSSTAFSSMSGVPQGSANLTKQQMEIAKSAGMSYREYANLLSSIPKKSVRGF